MWREKVCIITGAASGIGEACASRFVAEGANTAVADIRSTKAEQVAGSLGAEAMAYHCDVTDPAPVDALIADMVARFGKLDVMITNVGFSTPGFLAELTDDAWHRVTNGCLSPAIFGLRAALRPMRARGRRDHLQGLRGGSRRCTGPGRLWAAKAGVIAMTPTAAIKTFEAGVSEDCILPNAATAPLTAEFDKHPAGRRALAQIEAYGRFGRSEEMAAVAVF